MDSIFKDLDNHRDLSFDASVDVATQILNGTLETDQLVTLLTLLYQKGESSTELLGFIHAMRHHMASIDLNQPNLIDICGTGGSLVNRFNVSTCVALLLGDCGYTVAKHGNRGSSRANGSFDFLDALNIPYELSEAEHQKRIQAFGCTFLFARLYHPAVRHAAVARQQLKHRSIFNLIGPFCNPASPNVQIIGTPSPELAHRLFDVGMALDYTTFAVITSDIGLDECATVGRSTVRMVQNNVETTFTIDPLADFGINHTLTDIIVHETALASDNARMFESIIDKKNTDHPIATLIILNAAVIMHIINPKKPIKHCYQTAITAFGHLTIPKRIPH